MSKVSNEQDKTFHDLGWLYFVTRNSIIKGLKTSPKKVEKQKMIRYMDDYLDKL